MRKNKKKRYNNNSKCKNLSTANLYDLPKATRTWLFNQILMLETNNGASVVSLVTSPSKLPAIAPQG